MTVVLRPHIVKFVMPAFRGAEIASVRQLAAPDTVSDVGGTGKDEH